MRTTNTNQNPRPRCLPQALHRANRRSHQTRPNRRRDGTKAHHDRKRLLHRRRAAANRPPGRRPRRRAAQQLFAPARRAQRQHSHLHVHDWMGQPRREGRGRPRPRPHQRQRGRTTRSARSCSSGSRRPSMRPDRELRCRWSPGWRSAYRRFSIMGTALQVLLAKWPANIGVGRTIQNESSVLLK